MKRFLDVAFVAVLAVAGLMAMSTPASATIDAAVVVPSPNVSFNKVNVLNSVSCLSSTACTAVGYSDVNAGPQTLVQSWDGATWSLVDSPNAIINILDFNFNQLNSVSCTSTTSCTAVGFYTNSIYTVTRTLVLSFDGTSWTIVDSPNAPSQPSLENSTLESVSCTSSVSCMAVGWSNDGTDEIPLAMSWDGTNWTLMTTPTVGADGGRLLSVSCISPTSCTAVGQQQGSLYQTLVMSWNGSAWSHVASPNHVGVTNQLFSVSCVATDSCVAVGSFSENLFDRTLVLTWNGSSWNLTDSPNNGLGDNELDDVSCTDATTCIAVGVYGADIGDQALMLAFDGTSWTLLANPSDIGAVQSGLFGVSCSAVNSCFAVGTYQPVEPPQTLIIALTGPAPPTTTTSTTSTTLPEPVAPAFTG